MCDLLKEETSLSGGHKDGNPNALQEDAKRSLADISLPALIEEDARNKLCGGRLLLRIRLASDEVAALKEPAPLFRLAPRLAYLPLLFNDCYEHFQSCLPPRMGQSYEIWFDYNNVALKWHYPLGVLCDVLMCQEVPTPIDLTVHFRGCNSKDFLPFSGIGDLQRIVMSAFRQAVFLQQGSTAPFMKLPKQQQTQLWDSISKSHLEAYSSVQRQLLCKSLSHCKSLAVRLHVYGPPHAVLLHPTSPFSGKDGTPLSVKDFLEKAMPPILSASGSLVDGVALLTHGIQVPLDTPLYWLAMNAAYLDHFVHLVARVPQSLLSSSCDAIHTIDAR